MSDRALLTDAVTRIFRDFYKNELLNRARHAGWCAELWTTLEHAGMTLISVPEDAGGSGGDLVDVAEVLRLAGKYCASVPLAETALLGGWALARAGMPIPAGPLAFGVVQATDRFTMARDGGGWCVSGTLRNIPWARHAASLVLVASAGGVEKIICVPSGSYQVENRVNIAGEARDSVTFDAVMVDEHHVGGIAGATIAAEAMQRGALARAIQMAGALEQVLETTLAYVKQRSQFGRPLIKFQAVQQELARLAGEAAIAKASAMAAAACVQAGQDVMTHAAIAKIKAGEAAQAGASIGHQLHGAIGVTDEYLLHHSTLRLWAWRSEYGNEAAWAEMLGGHTLDVGATAFWDEVTESGRDYG